MPAQLLVFVAAAAVRRVVAAPHARRAHAVRDRLLARGRALRGHPGEPPARARCTSLSGLAASVAAVIYVAHLGQAKSDAGTGYELMAITAVVLGGASIFGGRGTVLGTVLGLFAIVDAAERAAAERAAGGAGRHPDRRAARRDHPGGPALGRVARARGDAPIAETDPTCTRASHRTRTTLKCGTHRSPC